jgi:hypothetical protein
MRQEWEAVSRSDAMNVDPVECRARRAARPSATEQPDLVPTGRKTAEDLVQVNLGATGLRILTVLPIHEQNAH